MQFSFTEEQQAFADSVHRFARAHLEKDALERAHDARFPFDVAKLMGSQGLMGITLPEADGGQDGTLMDAIIAIEQVAAVCPRSADVVQFGNFGPIRTFAEYGTPQQKARWLPDLLQGRMVMSLGITEADAGSAATELKTSAKADGAHYVVNGSKLFSTFSPDAAIFLVYVRYGPGVGGIGSVIVERDTPGFTIGRPSRFMSGEEWCELHFDNCRVPAENMLLGPGGFKKQMAGCAQPPAVRPAAVRIPGPAVEVRRHGDQARRRAAPALSGGGECRSRHALGLRDRRGQGGLQSGRFRGGERGGADHGRHGL
jgi:alkylation response protein AidB-like acyl-CoA dehydrogenase